MVDFFTKGGGEIYLNIELELPPGAPFSQEHISWTAKEIAFRVLRGFSPSTNYCATTLSYFPLTKKECPTASYLSKLNNKKDEAFETKECLPTIQKTF